MQIVKIFHIFLIFIILIGCGGGGDQKANTISKSNQIKLVDDWLDNAVVTDSGGKTALYNGKGIYTFKDKPQGIVTLRGGTFCNTNIKNKIVMRVDANSKIISPIASFLHQYPQLKEKLLKALNAQDVDYTTAHNSQLFKTSKIVYIMDSNNKLHLFAKDLKQKSVKNYGDIFMSARALAKDDTNIMAYLNAITLSFFDITDSSFISKYSITPFFRWYPLILPKTISCR